MDSSSFVPPSTPLQVRFQQSEQGYIAYSLYHLQESPKARRRVRIQIGMSLLVMVLLAGFLGMRSGLEPGWIIAVLISSGLLIAWPKWQALLIKKAVQRGLTDEAAKELLGENFLEIREAGLYRNGPAGEMDIPWYYLIEVVAHKNFLFLVFDTYPGMAIPTFAFDSKPDMEFFEAEIRRLHSIAEEPDFEAESEEEEEISNSGSM